jgi:hypothetical protein
MWKAVESGKFGWLANGVTACAANKVLGALRSSGSICSMPVPRTRRFNSFPETFMHHLHFTPTGDRHHG